jgi:TolA-binding protein
VYPIDFLEVRSLTRTRQRLDRKALKQDGLLNFVGQAGDVVREHLNVALGVLAGAAVVVLLGVLWRHDAREKNQQSEQGLSAVLSLYAMNQPDRAIEAATSLQSTNPGSRAAVAARYLSGISQLQLGRFAEAEQSLRSYLEAAAKMPIYENAAHGALAAALEAQNRFADAAAEYRLYASKLDGQPALHAQLDEARVLREAGSIDEARTLLKKLADERMVAREAKLQLAVLENLAAARP